jgi:hypothetical protein
VEIIPTLLERLKDDSDDSLRLAYASSLGTLRSKEAISDLLVFLRTGKEMRSRIETALALARIVSTKNYLVKLWRRMQLETGTAVSQAVDSLRKRLKNQHLHSKYLLVVADDCARAFEKDDLLGGTSLISRLIQALPLEQFEETFVVILKDCVERMEEFGATRIEYVPLALHTIDAALNEIQGQRVKELAHVGR